jgi:hypothetical protein
LQLVIFPEGVCQTNGGADPGKPCVFPFVYKGVTYNRCPWTGRNNTHWCATKVDSDGRSIIEEGKWGTCGSTCPKKRSEYQKKYYPRREDSKNKTIRVLTQDHQSYIIIFTCTYDLKDFNVFSKIEFKHHHKPV